MTVAPAPPRRLVKIVAERAPIQLERRLNVPPWWLRAGAPLISAVIALLVTAVVLVASGHDPVATYRSMTQASVTDAGAWSATLVAATPLLFTGLAAGFAFRMKAWNIGGEGQLYAGAICAGAAGIVTGSHGLAVALPAMLAAGIAGGAVWAAAPGILRSYLGTNEILTSLMLNYVGGLVMSYLIFDSASYLRDLSSPAALVFPEGKEISAKAFWPGFSSGGLVVPLGFVIGVIVALGLAVLLRRTTFGFQMRVIADSPRTAHYGGMAPKRVFVIVMVISGALAGLAGASQIGDFSHLLDPDGLQQAQYGYTGIVVAALARYDPIGTIVGALFLGAITNAGFRLQGATFPLGLTGTIEGIILFFVLAGELILRYRLYLVGFGGGRSIRSAAEQGRPAVQVDPSVQSSRRVTSSDATTEEAP